MKIKKSQLVQIIKEEIDNVVKEAYSAGSTDPVMLAPGTKIVDDKTLEELIATWINEKEAAAHSQGAVDDISGKPRDPSIKKFIDNFGGADFPAAVARWMRKQSANRMVGITSDPDGPPAMAVTARGVRRDYLSDEEKGK